MGNQKSHGQPEQGPQPGPSGGNRPANNARIATPGSVADALPNAGGDAADFLGLNQELGDASTPAPAPAPEPIENAAPLSSATASAANASWLFQQREPEQLVLPQTESEGPELPVEPAPEIAYQEPESPTRRLKPALLAVGAAALVGMIGFATWSAFRASRSAPADDSGPSVVSGTAVPQGPELVPPTPSATARYPGRRAAPTGSEEGDASVAALWPSEPPPEAAYAEPAAPELAEFAPPEEEAVLESWDEAVARDAPAPTDWLDAGTDAELPLDETGLPGDPSLGAPSHEEESLDAYGEGAALETSDAMTPGDEPLGDGSSDVESWAGSTGGPEPEVADIELAPRESEDARSSIAAESVASALRPVGDLPPSVPVEPEEQPVQTQEQPVGPEAKPVQAEALPVAAAPATERGASAPVVLAGSWDGWALVGSPMPQRWLEEAPVTPRDLAPTGAAPSAPEVERTLASGPQSAHASSATAIAVEPAPEAAKPSQDAPAPKAGAEVASVVPLPTPGGAASASGAAVPAKAADAGGLRRASAQDLSGIWTDSAIPFDAIGGTKRVLTPSVGRVRVHLVEKQVLEGALYAVGEKQITLNTDLGRISVAADRVQKVERIEVARADAPGAAASEQRIKTPGGVVVGKILSTEGGQTVVQTKDGSRVTFASKDIQVQSGSKVGIRP